MSTSAAELASAWATAGSAWVVLILKNWVSGTNSADRLPRIALSERGESSFWATRLAKERVRKYST